ncbi:hypothetical protein WIW50_06610 [Flavobacteriaceae bacterium 3-367]
MTFLELILFLTALALLVVLSFFGAHRKIQKALTLLGLAVFTLHLLVGLLRWQMALVYLVMFLLGLLYFKKSTSYLFLRVFGFLMGIVLMGSSVFYAVTMPILDLDAPQGKYEVGNTVLTVRDEGRMEFRSKDPNDKRELLVEIWYPGEGRTGGAKTLWAGLYSGEGDVVSFFLNYLQEIQTHSHPNLAPAKGSYPLILFNHGLQMFSSQNTLLMEHLASHGYIVASIGHPYESIRVDLGQDKVILPEFVTSLEKFKEGMQWIAESSEPVVAVHKEIASLTDREARGKRVLTVLEKADAINSTAVEWTKDNQYVLSWLLENPPALSGSLPTIDPEKIGVMGMSIGGATAGELCLVDPRVVAGINIDGLPYGVHQKDSLKVPFMLLTSEDGKGMHDFMFLQSQADYYECHLTKTRHADLTDLAVVWPILKYYGQSGELSGKRVVEIMNTAILNFWEQYLKGEETYNLSKSTFPELHVQSNRSD